MGHIRDVMCPLRTVHPLSLSPFAPWCIPGYSFPPNALFHPAPSERSEQMSGLCCFCSSLKALGTVFTETFLMFESSFRTRASVSWSKFNSSAITLTVNHVFESAKSLTFAAFSWVPPHDRMTVHHLRHFLTYSKICGSQNSLFWLLLLLQCRISRLQIADWFHFRRIMFFSPNNTNEFM